MENSIKLFIIMSFEVSQVPGFSKWLKNMVLVAFKRSCLDCHDKYKIDPVNFLKTIVVI